MMKSYFKTFLIFWIAIFYIADCVTPPTVIPATETITATQTETMTPSSQPCNFTVDNISIDKRVIETQTAINVSVRVNNPDSLALLYDWKSVYGVMQPGLQSVSTKSIYTAATQPIEDTISVKVTAPGCDPVSKSIQITVIEPPITLPRLTATDTPTIITTGTTEPIIPAGYAIFDNFDEQKDLDIKKWKIYSQNGDCSQIQNNGLLNINCAATSQNVSFNMKPVDVLYLKVSGVAMASRVLSDDVKGNLTLVVILTGMDGDKRYYYLRSNAGKFLVQEVNDKDWKFNQLAEETIEPGVIHITRVEFKNGILNVWIDDKQVKMQTNLPVNAALTSWNIQPIVYCEKCGEGTLVANILWVALPK